MNTLVVTAASAICNEVPTLAAFGTSLFLRGLQQILVRQLTLAMRLTRKDKLMMTTHPLEGITFAPNDRIS
jgi:predicted phage tail protein